MSKRQKFVVSTTLLSIGLLVAILLGPQNQLAALTVLVIFSFVLTLYCLYGDLTGKKWMFVVLLPVLFTIATGLFYFLLPSRWLTRLVMLAVFAIGFYAILLALNIYLVSSISRSIKLLHAARTIGFLIAVVCAFVLYNVIFSLHTFLPLIVVSLSLISFLLITPIVWSMTLGDFLGKDEFIHIGILTLAITEIGTFISFWPISSTFAAIFLAGNFYTLVGVSQHWLEHRLFKRVLWEFIWVAVILVVMLFITAKWGG